MSKHYGIRPSPQGNWEVYLLPEGGVVAAGSVDAMAAECTRLNVEEALMLVKASEVDVVAIPEPEPPTEDDNSPKMF